MPKNSDAERLGTIFAWIWIITWFLAIWIKQSRWELAMTGLFALILAFGLALVDDVYVRCP